MPLDMVQTHNHPLANFGLARREGKGEGGGEEGRHKRINPPL